MKAAAMSPEEKAVSQLFSAPFIEHDDDAGEEEEEEEEDERAWDEDADCEPELSARQLERLSHMALCPDDKRAHGRGREALKGLAAKRKDVAVKQKRKTLAARGVGGAARRPSTPAQCKKSPPF